MRRGSLLLFLYLNIWKVIGMMARKKDDLNREKIPSYLRELIPFLT